MNIFIKCKFPPREIKASKWNTKITSLSTFSTVNSNRYVIYAPC